MVRRKSIPWSFEAGSLLVQRFRPTDEVRLFNAARESIPEVFPFLPWCHPDYERSETRNWLRTAISDWEKGNNFSFGIWDHANRFLGGCGLSRIDEHPVMNLGYWIRTSATGQGVATTVTRSLARFAFDELGMQRIEIVMSTQNHPSQRVAEKSGARFEGILRNRLLLHGQAHDAFLYSLVPDDMATAEPA